MHATPSPTQTAEIRGRAHKIFWRVLLVCVLVIAALVSGAVWYANTPMFANWVRSKVVAGLERATGGRVELGAFHWHLLHLAFEVDNLTIHGLEAPGQIPYAHVDRVYVRAKIISLAKRQIGLNYLEADHPVIHLIVYPNGATNQPHPKVGATSNKPVVDTIIDLKVNRAEVRDGVAIVNERVTPFNAAGNNMVATIEYAPAAGVNAPERYLGTAHIDDLTTQRGGNVPVHSTIDVKVELERNKLNLQSLQLRSESAQLNLNGSLTNFSNPEWQLKARGGVMLEEIRELAGVPGLNQGEAQLEIGGSGSGRSFAVDGQSRVMGASYHAGSIHVARLNAQARIHITQDDLKLTGIRAQLAQGGYIDAEMEIAHWLHAAKSEVPPLPPQTGRAARKAKAAVAQPNLEHGTIRAKLHGLGLATIMAIVAPPTYGELGFDTEASGDAAADWTGNAMAFTAEAHVTLMPPLRSTSGRVPMYGAVDARYSNVSGMVDIGDLDVHTPASQVRVTGALGAYPITRASKLQVELTTGDVEEFNRALTTLGVASRGKTGLSALPVALHGKAAFTGTITDSILNPDVKGHVDATDFDLTLSTPQQAARQHTIHWDSADAMAEYSSRRIAVLGAELTHGTAKVHLNGELDAHEVSARRSEFDTHSALRAEMSVQDASGQDVLKMVGEDYPVTGTLNVTAHAGGTIDNLSGGGHVTLQEGTAYGEAYKSLNAEMQFAGREVDAANLVLIQDGGKVTGNGGYNLATKQMHFSVQGSGFDLAHFKPLHNGKYPVTGTLAFEAHGSGAIQSPALEANLHLTHFNFDNVVSGYVDAEAHTQGRTLLMNANANLSSAQVRVDGRLQFANDYPAQAQLTVTNLNVDAILRAMDVQGVTAQSSLGAVIRVSGPLREPRKMNGDAMIQQFAISLAGIGLKSDGAVHATLANGDLHLDPLHITGEDTNLRAQGSVGVLNTMHDLNLQASGSVNMKLAQTLSSNISSSGHVDFNVEANGTFAHPGLTGNVKFTDVSFAMLQFPNGISKMNGTLRFDQDRLDVQDLTAISGGGQMSLSGFVTYQQGLYGDISATAKDVRIRYPQGMSTTVNAKLRLQGTQKSSLISGNVTITRFALVSGLDLSAFGSSAVSVTLPPNPESPSNRVRLDIHIASAPQLDFQNSFAKLAGDVNLRVRGTVAQPAVLGHISITEGNATFAGTKYELQHGDIYFSNPVRMDPTLDLSATAHVEDYDITIGLTGTASKPVPTFRSEPPLSEQDIFSLLALGRTQEEQQIYSNMQAQAGVNSTADALLGGALNATVSSRIQKLFGGGSVKIDPTFVTGSGNATARITVEQQVSKNATLTYATNVNSTAQQLIQAEIDLTQNFSVIAVRDESGVFSLIFKLRRRYK